MRQVDHVTRFDGPLRPLALALVVASLAVSCTTSETRQETINVDAPGEGKSILDTQLKILHRQSKEYPKRADLPYKIAKIHFKREDFRDAAEYLRKAIHLAPGRARYYFHLGRVHIQMGEMEEAEKAFSRAVEVGGDDRWTILYSAHGYTLCHLKRWEEARTCFEKCVEIESDNPTPYYFLGSIADITGRKADAIEYLETYLEKGGRAFRRRAIELLRFHGVEVTDEIGSTFGAFEDLEEGLPSEVATPGK